jgi:hypothetical protein
MSSKPGSSTSQSSKMTGGARDLTAGITGDGCTLGMISLEETQMSKRRYISTISIRNVFKLASSYHDVL